MKNLIVIPAAVLLAGPAFSTPHHPHLQQTPATATANTASNANSDASSNSSSSASTTNNNAPTNTYQPRTTTTNSNTTNFNYPQVVPNMVGPVPRGSVPVLSVYGQLDYQQRGVYGAQISIPLAR